MPVGSEGLLERKRCVGFSNWTEAPLCPCMEPEQECAETNDRGRLVPGKCTGHFGKCTGNFSGEESLELCDWAQA